MPVRYTLYQDNREKSLTRGKYYARAKSLGTKNLSELASLIEENVSVKYADVLSVLKELVVQMTHTFQDGYNVKLDNFGLFRVGLVTKAANSPKEFTVLKNIVGTRLNFVPEMHWSAADGGVRRKQFLEGLKFREYDPYDDLRGDDEGDGENGNGEGA